MSIPTQHNRSGVSRVLAIVTSFLVAVGGLLAVPVAAHAAEATITVTDVTIVDETSVTVSVQATGLPSGIYAALIPKGADMSSADSPYLDFVLPFPTVTDGASSFTLTGSISPTGAHLPLEDGVQYEVLVWKIHSGASDSTIYGRADLNLSQDDWDRLFPPAAPIAIATTTSLSVSDTEVTVGDAVTLTATVTPAEAAGSVVFSSNGAPIADGEVALSGGSATLQTELPAGPNGITATFEPSDTTMYLTSTSAQTNINVVTAPVETTPKVTVTPTTDLDPAVENILTVTGTGFTGPGAASGAYVLFGETTVWSGGSAPPAEGWIDSAWVRATDIVDGAFTATITIPANALNPAKEYHLATSAAHRLSGTDRSLDTFTRVTVKQPVVSGPKVTVTPSADLDPAIDNELTVSGTGFEGPGARFGAYVLFGETSLWSGGSALPADGWDVQGYVPASRITDGAFTTTIMIPAGTLDPSKKYQVATSAAHGLSATDRSLDTFTPVGIAAGPVAPAVHVSAFTVKQGGQITFSGVGFPAGADVTATVNSTPVDLGTKTANEQGMVSFPWTVPADFAVGQHTITLVSGSVTVSNQFMVEALVIVPDGGNKGPAIDQCVARSVAGGSMTWGLKASFASYVTGPIAKGSFSGGTFNASSGSFNVNDGGVGRANFSGSIVATGHNGLLNFQLSNPSVQITGPGTAVLFAYVNSTDSSGAPAINGNVAFANLSFSGPSISGDTLSVSNATATLTGAGAQAFATFYSAGTALDPVTFSISLGAQVPCDATTNPVTLAATGAEPDAGLSMLSIGGLAMLLGYALLRRRRQTTAA